MHYILLAASVAIVALLADGRAAAQSVAPAVVESLQGTWLAEASLDGSAAPEQRVITVGPDWLRISTRRDGDDRPPELIYRLDGAETVNPFGADTARSRLEHNGDRLALETVYIVSDRPVTVMEHVHLNGEATVMTVERMVRVEHGYQGVAPALQSSAPNVSKATIVFRKVS